MTSQQIIDTVRSSINPVQYSQLLHYTALHTHNTAVISTPIIHGIDGRMALIAEMVMEELQAQLDCQTGQGKIDRWLFSYVSNEYSTSLLSWTHFSHSLSTRLQLLPYTYVPTHVSQSLV